MLGGPVALILTFHEGAMVLSALVGAVVGLLSLFPSRRLSPLARTALFVACFAGAMAVSYESVTRTLHVDGLDVEVVRTAD